MHLHRAQAMKQHRDAAETGERSRWAKVQEETERRILRYVRVLQAKAPGAPEVWAVKMAAIFAREFADLPVDRAIRQINQAYGWASAGKVVK